jgi:hypothetical protein
MYRPSQRTYGIIIAREHTVLAIVCGQNVMNVMNLYTNIYIFYIQKYICITYINTDMYILRNYLQKCHIYLLTNDSYLQNFKIFCSWNLVTGGSGSRSMRTQYQTKDPDPEHWSPEALFRVRKWSQANGLDQMIGNFLREVFYVHEQFSAWGFNKDPTIPLAEFVETRVVGPMTERISLSWTFYLDEVKIVDKNGAFDKFPCHWERSFYLLITNMASKNCKQRKERRNDVLNVTK